MEIHPPAAGSGTCSASITGTTSAGTITTSQTATYAGGQFTSYSNTVFSGGPFGPLAVAAADSRGKTAQAIQRFTSRRNSLMLSNDLDGNRQVDRLAEFDAGPSDSGNAAGLTAAAAPTRPDTPATPIAGGELRSGLAANPLGGSAPMLSLGQRALTPGAGDSRSDTGSMLERLFGQGDDASAATPWGNRRMPFAVQTQADGARSSFSTSLRDIMRYSADEDSRKLAGARAANAGDALGYAPGGAASARQRPSAFDAWMSVAYTGFGDNRGDAGFDGHFTLFRAGADYVVNSSFLAGAYVQYDHMQMRSDALSTDVDGSGWMAGPYATLKLSRNIYFQTSTAWGKSSNSISPFMTYVDKFDSTRWQTSGTLRGDWAFANLLFRPSASIAYIEDRTDSYVDSLGNAIPSIKSTLAQAKFGPEVAYRMIAPDGGIVEPRVGLQGVWNFAGDSRADGALDLAETGTWEGGIRGKVEAGLRLVGTSGIALDLSGAYDGIGSSTYHATTGQGKIRLPLN